MAIKLQTIRNIHVSVLNMDTGRREVEITVGHNLRDRERASVGKNKGRCIRPGGIVQLLDG